MTKACIHKWMLESPHGPLVHGVCAYCGDERTYNASLDESLPGKQRHNTMTLRSDPRMKDYSKAEAWKGPKR